mmetsp:Transcript_29452/g.85707  ORF Transcript_29452/g.85707 Transcript_29452/m.85707 type:complete len:910 (+) Transcript_29452:175-2904(+)
MFRVVANGASLANTDVAAGQPIYASISSTPKHRSGKILTVGRSSKNNVPDLIFGKDGKTVSRNHLTLRLVKIGVPTPAGTPDAEEGGAGADAVGEATEEAEGNAFGKPRNPEEIAACQEAADGIILVLENTGSLGTFVEYPEAEAEEDDKEEEEGKKKDDDDTDDDETDDEAGSQATAKAKAASGGNKSSSKTKVVRHRMEKGDSFIVKSLSLPDEEEAAAGDSNLVCATAFSSLPTIRVGLGPMDAGTNFPKVVLEITRVPMNLCITRVDTKSKSKLSKMADELGVHVVHSKEGWVTHPSHPLLAYTHLLAPDMTSTSKSIVAWCLKKPIVHIDFFFKGLAERKSFGDPMPKESDYSPEDGKDVIESDAAKAEKAGNGPCSGRRDPLKGFVVISLIAGESESLVMAAGGTIYRAYYLDDDAFNAGAWLDELEAAEKAPIPAGGSSGASAGGTVVLIETASKKVKKRRDFLRARNIHGVAQKEIAQAINDMRATLKTSGGESVTGRENIPSSSFRLSWSSDAGSKDAQAKASLPESAPSPEETEAARLSTIQEVSREDESRNESSERPPSVEAKKKATKRPAEEPSKEKEPEPMQEPEPEPAKEPEPEPMAEEPQEAEEGAARGKRKRGGAASKDQVADADDEEAAEEPPKATKRSKKSRSGKDDEEDDEIVAANNQDDEIPSAKEESKRSKRKRNEEEAAGAEANADRTKKKRSGRKASKGQDNENEERIVKATSNPNEHREPLPKAKKTGWLSAAPKDANERAKYKSTKADLDDIDAPVPSEAAITVKKTGLVVRSNEEYQERRAQMMAARRRGPRVVTGRDGKPVKDFKRFRKNTIIRGSMAVSFRSVLPKESERQRQLEQMQRELEKSTREADALFMGEEAGSITSFFGKSTTKKKKGSRSRTRR